MKLLLCLAAVSAASSLFDENLEPRGGPDMLGQPMGPPPPAPTKLPSSHNGRPTLASLLERLDGLLGASIAARDLGDSELEDLIMRDMGEVDLEELVARAKLEGPLSSFRPINRTPVREPLGGGGKIPNFKIGTVVARDVDDFEDYGLLARELGGTFHPVNHFPVRKPIGGGRLPERYPALSIKNIARRDIEDLEEFGLLARTELKGGRTSFKPVSKVPVRKPLKAMPAGSSKFRVSEPVERESVTARDTLDDES